MLINLSGILLARGRTHGNWFANSLGYCTVGPRTPLPTDASADLDIGADIWTATAIQREDSEEGLGSCEVAIDENTITLKPGIVLRYRNEVWEILLLPVGAVMKVERKEDETVLLENAEDNTFTRNSNELKRDNIEDQDSESEEDEDEDTNGDDDYENANDVQERVFFNLKEESIFDSMTPEIRKLSFYCGFILLKN